MFLCNLLNHICENTNFVDLRLFQYGMEKCTPLHSYGPAVRQNFIFHYILSGEGSLELNSNEQVYKLHAGQGFMIFPGEVCTYRASQSNPWHYAWFEFNGVQTRDCMLRAGFSELQPIFTPIDPYAESHVQSELMYLCEHTQASFFEKIAHAYLLLQALEVENLFHKPPQATNLQRYCVDTAIDYISNHFIHCTLTVDDIAQHCGIDRSYLSRLFRNQLGVSTQAFLIQYRMSVACQLLSNPKLPIKTIATSVGYLNQLHFSRAFKKTYGVSPRAWRTDPRCTQSSTVDNISMKNP